MAAPQTSSRLQLLQARFQQKQLQEKEQKLLQLYDQQQQRAHQVAQRGSAGSNGSNGSSHGSTIANPTGKVRQMFDERRQNNGKGIDKSYPLEPLKKQIVNGRKNALTKRNSKTELHSAVNSSSNNRPMVSSQRENFSRESYASSRTSSKDSNGQRENLSRDSYASSRGESRQVETSQVDSRFNGQPNNGQYYEINIDDVIDNEAMERNRMLAKFHAVEIEKRRRFADEFPEDLPADESNARKSPQAEARGERLKNASVKKVYATPPAQPTSTRRRTEQGIPRQSTLMKTTKSASLKIRKLQKKKTLEDKKKSSRKVEEKLKQESTKEVAQVENPSSNWSDILKSTSLIYQVIRSHTKFEESSDANKLGKVMTIVTKIEESTKESAKAGGKMNVGALATENENKQKVESPNDALNSEKGEDKISKQREEKDQGDGLISLEGDSTLTIRGNRECSVEKPTDCQEMTVADQTWIKVKREKELPRPSTDCANRVRRASFELKRLMFEQIQSREQFARRDSVESALRHFDSIGLDVTDSAVEPVPIMSGASGGEDKKAQPGECTSGEPAPLLLSTNENSRPKSPPPPTRLCRDLVKKDEDPARGFERHTSAWSIRTARGRLQALAPGKMLSRRKVRDAGRLKKSSSKKLFEARDSIELARVFIGAKSPVCRGKHLDSPVARKLPTGETTIAPQVKSQSSPSSSESQKVRTEGKQIFKNDQSLSSTPRRPGELNLKKSPQNNKASESTSKADVTPYPSSKSPDNTRDHKNRATTKSSSLKFLNQIVASNETVGAENGFSNVDTQDSDASAFLENKSFEDEKALGTAAPRTASSLSSSSNVGAHRQSGAGNARQAVSNRAKSNATPTPAQRSSLPAKNNNANDDALITCKICNRRFTTERIILHEQICSKTSQKKRKTFDTVTQRVKGTELEPFVAKPVGSKKQSKVSNAPASKPPADPPKSNWRRKHEDFINAIRSAKQMQAHLAAGGKLSDLPPPPPSDTSDYVQCPHCSRKFNQGAAERHIPKCETMQHNKPRVQPRSIKR